jgi:P-type Ca2+ transporter type 2C
LISLRPRPRGQSELTPPVLGAATLRALAITIGVLSLIYSGATLFGSAYLGSSIAFTSFSMCLIVAAFECHNETHPVLALSMFDNQNMNWVAPREFALAAFTIQVEGLRCILGTPEPDVKDIAWALPPAIAWHAPWEIGKQLARRTTSTA